MYMYTYITNQFRKWSLSVHSLKKNEFFRTTRSWTMQHCYRSSSDPIERRCVWVQCTASGEELSASGTLLEKWMKTLATYHCLLSLHSETITILKQLPTSPNVSPVISHTHIVWNVWMGPNDAELGVLRNAPIIRRLRFEYVVLHQWGLNKRRGPSRHS